MGRPAPTARALRPDAAQAHGSAARDLSARGPLERRSHRLGVAITRAALVVVALLGTAPLLPGMGAQGTAGAQSAAGQPSRVASRPPGLDAAVVFAGLELTAAQRERLKAITAEAQAERARILGASTSAPRVLTSAERAGLDRVTASQVAAIDAVLTPAQRTRLASNLAAARAQREVVWRAQAESAPAVVPPADEPGGAA